MKAITKSLLAVLFVAAVGLVNLNAKDINPDLTLSQEISELMRNVVIPGGQDYQADVKFLVNENHEIVVISVDSENEEIKTIIKNRLNYKKVETEKVTEHQINLVKVTLKQPS